MTSKRESLRRILEKRENVIRGGTKQTKETRDRSQRAEASHVLWLPMNGKASQAVIQHNTMHAVMILGHRHLYNTMRNTIHAVIQHIQCMQL